MMYNTPVLDLLNRLAKAFDALASECESNDDFATEHRSELLALTQGYEVRSEVTKFLEQANADNDGEVILLTELNDWDATQTRRPHTLRVTANEACLDVALWPTDAGEDGPQTLNVMFEVNRGLPAAHVHGDGGQEAIVHIHALTERRMEVTKASQADHWCTASSQPYPASPATVWAPPGYAEEGR